MPLTLNLGALEFISVFSILPPCGMVLIFWQRINLTHRIIGGLVVFTFLMEALGWYYSFHGMNNLFLFNIFTWVEGVMLTIYYYILTAKSNYRYLFLAWGLVFLVMSVFAQLYGESPTHYNSVQRTGGSMWSLILCIFFFFYLFQKLDIKNLISYSHYWMTSGFLLYFAGMLFLNLLADYVITHNVLSFNSFIIHSILNIFLNIIYTIVIWLGSKEAILRKS